MARKEAPKTDSTKGGANEVLGISLLALAGLFLLALYSFDRGDLSFNGTEINNPLHNHAGTFGAWLAQGCFMALGMAAYLLPPLMLIFSLAFLFSKLEGLRKRWPWTLTLILAVSAGLSLYPNLFGGPVQQLNTVDPGGYVGLLLHKGIFIHVGTAGATVILLAVYLLSLLYLTNFKLKDWGKAAWQRWRLRRIDRSKPLANEEIELAKREEDLAQRVADLKKELDAAAVLPDEAALEQKDPRIIDLSQPGARSYGAGEDEESTQARRKLAAIVFTDIVGYTTLANRDEKAALKLIKQQRRLLKPIVKRFEGEWLKEIGDGLLLSFDSSLAAVECALAIQDKVRGVAHLDLRIGIHQGDIVRDGKDVLGDGVNIASRIEEYAPIGGVAVSEKIQQDLISHPEYAVKLLGEFSLDGVEQKLELYTVTTGTDELEETKLMELIPEQGETVLPPDGPEDEKDTPDREAATAEDILGEPEEDTEPTVHIAPPTSSTGPAKPRKRKPTTVARGPVIKNYECPPVDYLQMPEYSAVPVDSTEELKASAIIIQNTLKQFGVDVTLGDITKGPTITRFELHPAPGVKMERITAYTNNITAALEAERISILAPVPGKSTVGVEVPNAVKTKVIMRDLLESDEWKKSRAKIPVALGKDVYGKPIIADLAEMPHLLIAGATGSGKSVCMNGIIASLLYRFSPDELRLVMIDPKVVELQIYNILPHLVVPVVTDPKKVILALRWVVQEMEKRYKIFAKENVKNIYAFNKRRRNKPKEEPEPELPLFGEGVETNSEGFAVEVDEEIAVPRDEDIEIPEKLSYIVVVIDELADLMLTAPADVENAIARITQMARAAGIHCIVATQRPSVKVITGVIKANIPSRIAFQVASKIDSRVILDEMGAEKLLGKGDMLYQPPGAPKPIRAQGPLVEDAEIQQIVDFIAKQGKPSYEMEIHKQLSKPMAPFDGGNGEDEELVQQCIEVIRSEQKASVSKLQRRLRLGYNRAARLMDELEDRGIVGPARGNEPREILIDLDGTGADGHGQGVVETTA